MSDQENIKVAHAIFDAWNARRPDSMLGQMGLLPPMEVHRPGVRLLPPQQPDARVRLQNDPSAEQDHHPRPR